jgi:trehalose-phosphatase
VRGTPADPLQTFFEHLSSASQRALLLDYDGTIAPFSSDWKNAFPYPGLVAVLSRILSSATTRLGIVSGRPERDLERLLGMDPQPEMWGSHGLEHRPRDGTLRARELSPAAAERLAEASSWIRGRGWGAMLEEKPFGLALHSRGVRSEEFVQVTKETSTAWSDAFASVGLRPLEFDGGLEWRPPGDKGEVVAAVLSEMDHGAVVAYLGDDRTDEDAFLALSGRGLGVLVRPEVRKTAAQIWIRPPGELIAFLERWEQKTSST